MEKKIKIWTSVSEAAWCWCFISNIYVIKSKGMQPHGGWVTSVLWTKCCFVNMNRAKGKARKKNNKNDRHQQTYNDDTSPTTTTSSDDVFHWFSLWSKIVESFEASKRIRFTRWVAFVLTRTMTEDAFSIKWIMRKLFRNFFLFIMEFTTRKTTSKSLTNGKFRNGKLQSRPPSVINLDTKPSTIAVDVHIYDVVKSISIRTRNWVRWPQTIPQYFCLIGFSLWIIHFKYELLTICSGLWKMLHVFAIHTQTQIIVELLANPFFFTVIGTHNMHSMRRFKHLFKSPTRTHHATNTLRARFPSLSHSVGLNYKFMNRLFTCQVDSRNL